MLLYNICLQGYNTSVSFISALWFQSFKKNKKKTHANIILVTLKKVSVLTQD